MAVVTMNTNSNQAPSILISWNDTSTTENRSGSTSTIIIKIDSITDPEGQSITSIWQINTGSGFVDNVAVTSNPMNFNSSNGVNQYRIKSTDAFGVIGYSNILRYTNSAPQYDNYFASSDRRSCNANSSTNFISFNSSGGYRTGVNYSGATPVTLRLISFTDTMVELTGSGEVALSFTPSVLRDSANTPLTYPYNITLPSSSVSDVGINQSPASPELVCPSNPANQVRRRRIITYQVIDVNGTVGPIRTSELDLLYTPESFIFDADYAVLTYKFNDATDLDTRTRIVEPNIGMNNYLGFEAKNCFPNDASWSRTNIPTTAIIDWSGDNIGTGYESILVDIQKLKALKPDMINLVVDLRAAWYNSEQPMGVLPVEVKAMFYKGGTMLKSQPVTNPLSYEYTNPTATNSLQVTSDSKVINTRYQSDRGVRLQRLAVFKYNVVTKVGSFDINDTTTPAL